MIKPTVEFKRDPRYKGGLEAIIKNVKPGAVEVGILAGTGVHPNAEGGQTVAEVAVWNEFGTKRGTPPRPFLRATMRTQRRDYSRLMARLLKSMINRKLTTKQAQGLLGLRAQSDVRETLVQWPWKPNTTRTIARKKSATPLVDTGFLRQSINWAAVRGTFI